MKSSSPRSLSQPEKYINMLGEHYFFTELHRKAQSVRVAAIADVTSPEKGLFTFPCGLHELVFQRAVIHEVLV